MQKKNAEGIKLGRLPYQSFSIQKLLGEIGIASFLSFIAPAKFQCLPPVRDVRLSRALSLILMQVEIPWEAPPTFPREMSRLPGVTLRLFFLGTIVPFSALFYPKPLLPLSVSFSLLLPLLPLFLSAVVPSRPFVSRPLAPLALLVLPLSSSCYLQVGLLAFIVGGSRFSSFYFSISRRMRFSSSFPLRQYCEGAPTSRRSEERKQKRQFQKLYRQYRCETNEWTGNK